MTTLQQTQPPILCYEIWEMEDGIHGSLIDWKPYWSAIKDYPVRYEFRGHTLVFEILTHDLSISKRDALSFCSNVALGRVRRISVDLTPCQTKPKK